MLNENDDYLNFAGLSNFFDKLKKLFVTKNDLNNIRGSLIYCGTNITGTNTTATIFSGSGIDDALIKDLYINTSDWNIYQCTVSGSPNIAKWTYMGNIKGIKGDNGATPELNFEVRSDGHLYLNY